MQIQFPAFRKASLVFCQMAMGLAAAGLGSCNPSSDSSESGQDAVVDSASVTPGGMETAPQVVEAQAPVPNHSAVEANSSEVELPQEDARAATGAIQVEGDAFRHFGTLLDGSVVHAEFELLVPGPKPAVVASVQKSCGCTGAALEVLGEEGSQPYSPGQVLEPGTRLRLRTSIDTTGKHGEFQSMVYLLTGDPVGPVRIDLRALVQQFFRAEIDGTPQTSMDLGQLFTNDVRRGEFEIASNLVERFQLNVQDAMLPPQLKVDLEPVDPDEAGLAARWKASFELGPDLEPSSSRPYPIQFISDQPKAQSEPDSAADPEFHKLNFYLIAEVEGLVVANPAQLYVGIIQPGKLATRTLRIVNRDESSALGKPNASLTEDCPLRDKAEFLIEPVWEEGSDEGGAPDAWDVSLTLMAPTEEGSVRSFIVLELDHPGQSRLVVPFSYMVRKLTTREARSR